MNTFLNIQTDSVNIKESIAGITCVPLLNRISLRGLSEQYLAKHCNTGTKRIAKNNPVNNAVENTYYSNLLEPK